MSGVRAGPLVGRDAELAVGLELLRDVAAGGSATLLITGEAGIGKTELTKWIEAAAEGFGASVARGGAHPFERERPFGALATALGLTARSPDPRRAGIARLLIDASGATASDVRYRVVAATVDLVERECSQAPLVLIVEDLQWADEATLAAFGQIASDLTHLPVLLVGSMRPSPRRGELDVLVDHCYRLGARLVELRSWTANDVRQYVESELEAAPGPALASIVEKAGGNPLWVAEILRALVAEGWLRRTDKTVEAVGDELPDSLRALVLRRLQYLPACALELLRVASVLGESVSVHDLALVTGRSRTEIVAHLDEAFRARLLDAEDNAVVFRHQLVQQAIYEDLPAPARRALHRDIAAAVVRLHGGMAKAASHLLLGADRGDVEAVAWLRQAAAEVSAGGAPSAAVDLLRRAAALLPEHHPDHDLVESELAEALLAAGRVAEGCSLAADRLARRHSDEADVRLRLTVVSALSLQNRPAELIEATDAALRTGRLSAADRALVLVQASYGQTFSRDFVGGETSAAEALDVARTSGSVAMSVWALCAGSVAVKTLGRYHEALAMTTQAVALAFDPVDDEARLRHPHFFLAMALADGDKLMDAVNAYRRALEESETLGTAWLLPDMLLLSGEARFLLGDWDDAEAEFEAGLGLAHRHGQRVSLLQTRGYQLVMASMRGDTGTARRALADLEQELESDRPGYGAEVAAFAYAANREACGQRADAYDLLMRFWNRNLEDRVHYYDRYLAPALVRLALLEGEPQVASEITAASEVGALLAPAVPSVQAAVLRCRGLIDRDPEALLGAVDLARSSGRVLDRSAACEEAATILAETGFTEDAVRLLREARDAYDTLQAHYSVARVAAALRSLGVRGGARGPRKRAESGWGGLTASERAVCELVAEGLTNREVAVRLHVSPHTVNTHLRHVFRKLSVSTRAELAAAFARNRKITHSRDVSEAATV